MKGLYTKYTVINNETGEEISKTFTLVPDMDPIAKAALKTYADLTPNQNLKNDLKKWLKELD